MCIKHRSTGINAFLLYVCVCVQKISYSNRSKKSFHISVSAPSMKMQFVIFLSLLLYLIFWFCIWLLSDDISFSGVVSLMHCISLIKYFACPFLFRLFYNNNNNKMQQICIICIFGSCVGCNASKILFW